MKQWPTDINSVWNNIAMVVNRTVLYVDKKLEQDIDWLSSMACDLNDIEKNILSAFNVDVRRSPIECTLINLNY